MTTIVAANPYAPREILTHNGTGAVPHRLRSLRSPEAEEVFSDKLENITLDQIWFCVSPRLGRVELYREHEIEVLLAA